MSTAYINFSAIDFTGVDGLSTYALDLTPMTFIPALENDGTYRIMWNFGDGTTSKSFSANKSYNFPGIYTVEMVVYGCDNNALISTITKNITVADFLSYTLSVEGLSALEYPIGQITGPLYVEGTFPNYQNPTSIYFNISGSNSNNYWTINDQKYGHLTNFYAIYETSYNWYLSTYQYIPISKIDLNLQDVYGKVYGSSVVECLSTDTGSKKVGVRGTKSVYFKDDIISPLIYLNFFFDKTQNIIPSYLYIPDYLNNLSYTLSASVVDNTPVELSVTSNGLDGEGTLITSFNINPIKYYDTKIPFIIKLKDDNWFSVKNFDTISLSTISISVSGIGDVQLATEGGELLLDEEGNYLYGEGVLFNLVDNYTLSSLNDTLSSYDAGGVFRGYIMFPSLSNTGLLQNVHITASVSLTSESMSAYTLAGTSSYFNVYPSGYYDIYKKGEDFDAKETLKSLRFQETMLEHERLFDEFLGDVLGDEESSYSTIGKQLYEKITNFVANTQDPELCEWDHVYSLGDFLGLENNSEERYVYPNSIKRWINLLSIDKGNLLGFENKFAQNLDIKGRTTKTEYGRNIGDTIDPFTYIVDSDTPIVALEKFSNNYVLLNTYKPLSSNYPLSAYNSDWGWPLVLPGDLNFSDIEKYYLFFEYVPGVDGTVSDGVIDYENPQTTISSTYTLNDLKSANGVWENILLDTLYQSLSLL